MLNRNLYKGASEQMYLFLFCRLLRLKPCIAYFVRLLNLDSLANNTRDMHFFSFSFLFLIPLF